MAIGARTILPPPDVPTLEEAGHEAFVSEYGVLFRNGSEWGIICWNDELELLEAGYLGWDQPPEEKRDTDVSALMTEEGEQMRPILQQGFL